MDFCLDPTLPATCTRVGDEESIDRTRVYDTRLSSSGNPSEAS